MDSTDYQLKVSIIIEKAKSKGLIKTYSEFCNSNYSEEFAVNEEEEIYYTSLSKKNNTKFNIGDIVFISNYLYKTGQNGHKHIFVIIADGQAVDITYFGFLLSSQLSKQSYKYNEKLDKNSVNNLHKDSIVKCDDLISISEKEILFKIGEVSQNELERFIETYFRYLSEN